MDLENIEGDGSIAQVQGTTWSSTEKTYEEELADGLINFEAELDIRQIS